jgi:hypothetical protein
MILPVMILAVTMLAAIDCVASEAQNAAGDSNEPRTAEALFIRLGHVGLDSARVYHLRDAHLDRPGFYLTLQDGTIGFTEDVLGHVTGAFFEGEGEVLVFPPDRAERSSLALFTDAAILEEKFKSGYIRFNDGTFEELRPYLRPAEDAPAFFDRWEADAPRLAAGDALRLLTTYAKLLPAADGTAAPITTARPDRLLHARLAGVKLGVFDLLYDSLASEQVQLLQFSQAQGTNYYDIWMSFNPRTGNLREGHSAGIPAKDVADTGFLTTRYTIRARVTPPRRLEAEATLDLHVLYEGQRSLQFELSRYLLVSHVEVDGKPVEFIHNPAINGSQLERQGDDLVAVVFPRTLKAGERIALKFVYGGDVLSEEPGGLLYVGARGTWYPNHGLSMADFDLEFSYPAQWTLLATGKRMQDEAEGPTPGDGQVANPEELRSHWISTRPIPVAGFNLGRYTKATARAGNALVEAYATEEMDLATPKARLGAALAPTPGSPPNSSPLPSSRVPTSPAQNVQVVADRGAEALAFFAKRFGEYPYGSLALTQAPGPTSQGWPGLVFLSGYAFLSPEDLAAQNLRPADAVLARQTPAHETAHQWWGDLVLWTSYRDQWISEGLASYCALMQLEEKDPAAFRLVLDGYRDDLMQMKDGRRMWEAGPVTLGLRLNSSHFPNGYDLIAYGRGAWLFHMLRQMLRDAPEAGHGETANRDELFTQILRHVQEKYAGRTISTRELLQEFVERWPRSLWFEGKPSLDWFWDGWIQGTSVPVLEMKSAKIARQREGTWVTGVIVQREAPDDLVTPVPLYAEMADGDRVLLGRVFADGHETNFHLRAPSGTRRVVLDPQQTLLRQR